MHELRLLTVKLALAEIEKNVKSLFASDIMKPFEKHILFLTKDCSPHSKLVSIFELLDGIEAYEVRIRAIILLVGCPILSLDVKWV